MSTFTYFGEELAYATEWPEFEEAEFHAARAEVDLDPAMATGYALRLALACVAESDRGRFRELSRKNRAKIADWVEVYRNFTAEAAERPTGEPTGSSDGLDSTPKNSESEPVASVTSLPVATEPRPANGAVALALARSQAG